MEHEVDVLCDLKRWNELVFECLMLIDEQYPELKTSEQVHILKKIIEKKMNDKNTLPTNG